MKKRWTKTMFLIILMLMAYTCATGPKEEKSDKVALPQSDEKKIEKADEKTGGKDLDANEKKAIRKMAREIAKDRGADFYQTGLDQFNKGDVADAVEAFKKAVNENPKDFRSYHALGRSYEKLTRPEEAIVSYEAALKIKPDYLPAREAAGLLFFQQKKFQEAEPHLKIARTLGSKVAEVYYSLGEIQQRENTCKPAIVAFKQALTLNPDYVAARNGLEAAKAACKKKQPKQPPKTDKPL